MDYVKGKPYFKTIHPVHQQFPYLNNNQLCDVLIIGGGVTGAITAYYLSKQGYSVILVEKNRIAYGSTSVTTSLLQYELDRSANQLKEVMDLKDTIRSYKLGLEALQEIADIIQEEGNSCNYLQRDTLYYTEDSAYIQQVKDEYHVRKENGFNVELILEEDSPFAFPLKAGVKAINGGAELDPFLFTHLLLTSSLNKGVTCYENTEVIKIESNNQGVIAYTKYDYQIRASKVIIATGYHTEDFTQKKFAEKTITYNIVTKPIQNINDWQNGILLRDTSDPYYYLRTTPDSRIILGGEDIPYIKENFTEEKANEKYSLLEKRLNKMFPTMNIEIDFSYCGTFATTNNDLGFIGEDPNQKNVYYNLGYGANGILFAILGGKFLLKLFSGEHAEDLQLFSLNRTE